MPYLADSSIWSWSVRSPVIGGKLGARLERDEVLTCHAVVLEQMHRARTGHEYRELYAEYFAPLGWASSTADVADRALEVQRELSERGDGWQRRPAIDYLIAAAAELAGDEAVLWFLDKDLRIICEHTGQPFEAEDSP